MKNPISYREANPPLSNIEQFAFILVATILTLTLCFFALVRPWFHSSWPRESCNIP
jgi:hypothetical protein